MRFLKRAFRWCLWIAATCLVLLALGWWLARPATPDAFYEAAADTGVAPGTLLRSEPFTRAVPPGARAWRILYATTRGDGSPAVASGVVMTAAATDAKPRPVIAWAHGTTGLARGCAPSLFPDPFLNVPAVPQLLAENWVYVATDYVGLGAPGSHAYLVGEEAARAVLDSVRAARQIDGLALDNRVVVWGHSQGGNSALWVGQSAAGYATDVNLLGVAALAPASDLPTLLQSAQRTMFGKIVSAYLAEAYLEAYPDLDAGSYLQPSARLLAGDIARRCVGGRETLLSVAETLLLPRDGIFRRPPGEGAFGERLAENTPRAPIPVPLLVAQGEADDLVLARTQGDYVASRCAAGQAIDYRTYAARDHISVLAADSLLTADLIAWTRDRLAGIPAVSTCPTP